MENSTTSKYKCEKCHDEGGTLQTINGYLTWVECSCNVQRKINALLKVSGINPEEYELKSLETFLPDNEMAKAMKKNALDFLNSSAVGIGYFGKSGIGKTHICIAICQEFTKRHLLTHKYFSYRTEIQKLKSCFYDREEYDKLMQKWIYCKVLYLDDLFKFSVDKNGGLKNQDLEIMFDIINTRYINRSITIFSSEYSLKDIMLIDEALGSRIYSMVKNFGMKCEGENRRLKGE